MNAITHSPAAEPTRTRCGNGTTAKFRSETKGQNFHPACISGQKSCAYDQLKSSQPPVHVHFTCGAGTYLLHLFNNACPVLASIRCKCCNVPNSVQRSTDCLIQAKLFRRVRLVQRFLFGLLWINLVGWKFLLEEGLEDDIRWTADQGPHGEKEEG